MCSIPQNTSGGAIRSFVFSPTRSNVPGFFLTGESQTPAKNPMPGLGDPTKITVFALGITPSAARSRDVKEHLKIGLRAEFHIFPRISGP